LYLEFEKVQISSHIPAEMFQVGRETLHSEINKSIKLIWNKKELPHQWKKSIVTHVHSKGDKTDCSNLRGIKKVKWSRCAPKRRFG
jgi:hypothetical protein